MAINGTYSRKNFLWPALISTLLNPIFMTGVLFYFRVPKLIEGLPYFLLTLWVFLIILPIVGWVLARPGPFGLLAVFGIFFGVMWLAGIIPAIRLMIDAVAIQHGQKTFLDIVWGASWLCYPIWIRSVWKASMTPRPDGRLASKPV